MSEGGGIADLSTLVGARHLLQTELWGRFKSEYGWQPRAVKLESAGDGPPVLALFRRIGPLTMCYVPYPPPEAGQDGERLRDTARQISGQSGFRPVYVRFDLLFFMFGLFSVGYGLRILVKARAANSG